MKDTTLLKMGIGAIVIYLFVIAGVVGTVVYVAHHFISKWW